MYKFRFTKNSSAFLVLISLCFNVSVSAAEKTAVADKLTKAKTGNKPFTVMPHLNNPVGMQAFESFAGKDRSGKDGPMARVGMDLSLLYQEHRNFKMKGGELLLRRSFKSSLPLARIKNEKVVIDVVAAGDVDSLVQELVVLGMENISVYGRVISGSIPISSLEQTATIATLRFARPVYAKTREGSVTSQGDVALLSGDARSLYGIDGTGITVGTLSDSYNCKGGAAADVTSNDLPTGVLVLAEESGCGSGTDEGRAMMQIIHDVAPGVNQAFHTAFDGEASFANGIIELATIAGADIINDDVIYFAEPMFQDGIIAQAIDTVKAMGVAYFSAAGNQASKSYEATFVDSGVRGYRGRTRHDFEAGAGTDSLMEISIPANAQVIFVLQWQDPFFSVSGAPGADTDMDMLLYSSSGTVLAGGFSNNIGGDAFEIFAFNTGSEAGTYQLGIEHDSGPLPGKVKFVYFGSATINEYATFSGSSYGHPIAAGGRGVGAARYSSTPAYGVSPPVVEGFSSKGGTPILFDTSGNPVSEVRQKPDFVAPDGGDNTFFGSDYEGNGWPNFFGTSAAAPHAAGMAALLKEFDGSLSPDNIYAAMQDTAVDMSVAGFDFRTGHGLVQATLALSSLDDDNDTVPDSQDNCPDDANTTQDDFDNDGLGDVCDPDDDADGLSDADEILYGTNPLIYDSDGDTLGDGDEVNIHHTMPDDPDSDGDFIDDGDEILNASDPLDPLSWPNFADGDIAPLGSPDGLINAADYLIAQRIVLGELTATSLELAHGDLYPAGSPDGIINTSDLILLLKLVQ